MYFLWKLLEGFNRNSTLKLLYDCEIKTIYGQCSQTLKNDTSVSRSKTNQNPPNYSSTLSECRAVNKITSAVVLNSCPADPLLCAFWRSSLFNTPDSDHQLVRRELYEPWTNIKNLCTSVSPCVSYCTNVQQHGQQRRPVNTTTCKHNALVYKSDWDEVSVDSVLVHQSCLWSSCAILV